ncbi:MAG: AtzE family amidohydrolase [Caulobacteraceae bacterium]
MTVLAVSAAEIAMAVRSGKLKAANVAEQALARVADRDPAINAFTAVLAERAMADARAVDAAVAAGRDPGPLAGVPFAVKNLFDIKGVTTLAGSTIDADRPPAKADATAVKRLKAAGAVLVGALNMDEYAYGFSTENAHYGPTHNPHDPSRIAGGSSGGSAAAVAAGMVPITLGSDTNGSIRVPAALCGVFGLKPTFGRLSRRGVRPFVHSLDHIGPFARTARDLALTYDALQGRDPLDPMSAPRPVEPAMPKLDTPPTGLRVGVLCGWFERFASAEVVDAVWVTAKGLGGGQRVELEGAEMARAAAFCLSGAEGGALHLASLRARYDDFDPAVRDRLLAGALQPAAWPAKAQRVRRWFLEQALDLFGRFDVLLAPATPFTAPPIGQTSLTVDGVELPIRANLGLYTQPLSFIGLPVVAVPLVRQGRMPAGVQIIGAPWREDLLLRVAAWLEREGVVGAGKELVTAEGS